MKRPHLKSQRGMSLVEAMIALLVMAFGMLTLSGLQVKISRDADVARQRTEAVRLAQRRIDQLRSFTGISTGTINWNGLDALSADTIASTYNTTYTLTTAFSGTASDAMRSVAVTASWVDRANASQSVVLSSVISQTDPVDVGEVENPLPLNTPLKRPKNRNINIPIPALDLNNGTSSYQISATYAVIFSNISANVVKVCNPGVLNATVSQILASTCVSFTGFVVDGYVHYPSSSAWSGTAGINTSGITRNAALSGQNITCVFNDAVDQNNTNTTIANYKYYFCVVPLDTPYTWSGTVRLGGLNTSSNYIVCRYQYTQSSINSNEQNVQPYSAVSETLDEQNYYITTTNHSSPTDSDCPSSMTSSGVSTGKLHQNCRSDNANRATDCPASS